MDISADLTELGRTPVAVVCAGAKSVRKARHIFLLTHCLAVGLYFCYTSWFKVMVQSA